MSIKEPIKTIGDNNFEADKYLKYYEKKYSEKERITLHKFLKETMYYQYYINQKKEEMEKREKK